MKRILLLVLLIMILMTPCSFASEGNVYENQQYKFRMTIPEYWQINDKKGLILKISASHGFLTLSILGDFVSKLEITSDTVTQEVEEKTLIPVVKALQEKYPNIV